MSKTAEKTPVIGITAGDAAGIGPEIILKALAHPSLPAAARFIIYARKYVLDQAIELFAKNTHYELIASSSDAGDSKERISLVDPIRECGSDIEFGKISKELSTDAMRLVETATHDAMKGTIDGFVTAPINKKGIQTAGYNEKGHTGFIAGLACIEDYAMMFVGGPLKVVLLTIHVPLKDVPSMITRDAVHRRILLIHRSMKKWFGINRLKIAVCGINPHAGENGVIGTEDMDEILPAIEDAAKEDIRVAGPFPADTVFNRCAQGEFDVVLAMYHDQGLIPIKTLAFGKGVNITIGLPFIRTSPDHGTAYDIAGKGKADPSSMIEAIKLAVELSRRKK